VAASATATITGSNNAITLGNSATTTAYGQSNTITLGRTNTFVFEPTFGQSEIANFSSYDTGAYHATISLPSSEFANFAAMLADAHTSGSNSIITAANGDQLTLVGVTTTTLASLSADFTYHA